MASRKRITNFVTQAKDYGENHLRQAQAATPNMPKRFSGFLTARSDGFIYVYQYSNNRLIGCIVLHENNIKSFENTLNHALKQVDIAKTLEESIERNLTESE